MRFAIACFAAMLATAWADSPLPLSPDQLKRKGSATTGMQPDGSGAVHLRIDDPGWNSGLRVMPPAGQAHWDFSKGRVLAADVKNLSKDRQLRLTMHISSGSRDTKDESMVRSGVAVNPGETRTLNLFIPHGDIYHAPPGVPGQKTVVSTKINWVEFYMEWPFEAKAEGLADCTISNLRLTGEPDKAAHVDPAKYFPFIDTYGQNVHGGWKEKIHSDEDLKKNLATEAAELAASKRPAQWNKFGGWANGPQLKATGHFRTEKHEGKWWLVDPEGRLFFSQGIDVLRAQTDSTKSTGHEKWFAFEVKDAELTFNHWNLQKKYGKPDYAADYYATLDKRLEHWGMNTIGAWGHQDLMALGRTPYTLQLADHNLRLPRIAGSDLKFYDVFDPKYVDAMKNLFTRTAARNPLVAKSATDPMCIGYFIDNELNYGNRGRQILGDHVMRSPATQASKKEFIGDMKKKYGEIAKLNAAWETKHTDWDALLAGTDVPQSKGFRLDSNDFFRKTVDQYFRLCRDAVKTSAPDKLYLGSRFISTDAVRRVLFEASKQYCDVLTVNVYAHGTANLGAEGFPDMPVLLGEFHLGVLDRGMFSPGSVPTGVTQEERGMAYIRFVQGALVHPNIVGTHWFQFRDQPLTGRWDGEGYQVGFVDVADTPYTTFTRATREVGENMYGYRLRGKLENAMK